MDGVFEQPGRIISARWIISVPILGGKLCDDNVVGTIVLRDRARCWHASYDAYLEDAAPALLIGAKLVRHLWKGNEALAQCQRSRIRRWHA